MPYPAKVLAYLLLFSLAGSAPLAYAQVSYQAQVIDAETKQPIEGAAVLAVWWQVSDTYLGILMPHPVESVYDAQETLTDLNGNFTIPGVAGKPVDPPAVLKEPRFTVFKPGYEAVQSRALKPMSAFLPKSVIEGLIDNVYEKDGRTVVELRLLKTREERRENLLALLPISCSPDDPSRICVDTAKYPNLINLVNEERVNLGFKPITVP